MIRWVVGINAAIFILCTAIWFISNDAMRYVLSVLMLAQLVNVYIVSRYYRAQLVEQQSLASIDVGNKFTFSDPTTSEANNRWKSIYENMPLPALYMSKKGQIVATNRAFRDLIGVKEHQPLTDEGIIDPAHLPCFRVKMGQVLMDKHNVTIEVKGLHYEGYPQDWLVHIHQSLHFSEEQEAGCIIYIQDHHAKRHMTEEIHYMSYYDDMTGLPNRRKLMQHINDLLRMAKEKEEPIYISVLYMDIDRFKRINDTFGPDFGDMLLMQIAERLLRKMNPHDVLARMEGDEFACVLTSIHSDQHVAEQARQLLHMMDEPFLLRDIPVHVAMSIGVTIYNEEGGRIHQDDAASLVKKAVSAMSKVKEQGKNSYLFYTPEMNVVTLERLTLEHEMRNALLNNEYELYYQPQVEMNTERIVGMEALIRWNHPHKGRIPPNEFIPLAEESGFIVTLGEWVLEQACFQNKRWQDAGLPPIPVSVNLSVRQFEQKNLMEVVQEVLRRTGLPPQYLELEITETMTLDVERASKVLSQLKQMGVSISIDDFGTGYSSLHYLKNFPIHRLKIDRSFVRDLEHDPNDAAIVSAIIALGHTMNIHVIAEGVENTGQLRFLQAHACDEIQGYYFSPPIPGPEIEVMLQDQLAS
ncbi:bifunctional diguanylate cyclase/phosphodiesterase [Paenibacillus sp. CAU 1523]|uniref:Bifunctional diguanylate cyclase/phosphodiesterase n=2 Tax=Paenibacillus arenosi TaxID=2774142 RepID=A0ABR9B1X9_9BACL|nr:bifunctional diguanylate cyclase/phosphodiesterase [Paenibacillus arenosi]